MIQYLTSCRGQVMKGSGTGGPGIASLSRPPRSLCGFDGNLPGGHLFGRRPGDASEVVVTDGLWLIGHSEDAKALDLTARYWPINGLTHAQAEQRAPKRCQDRDPVMGEVGLRWIHEHHLLPLAALLVGESHCGIHG